jgi:hypothetical protein
VDTDAMASHKKTWAEKMLAPNAPSVQVLDKPFAGFAPGSKMLIATPLIVRDFIGAVAPGTVTTMVEMRQELASRHRADMTCPLTAGIFTRIVTEAALDEMRAGKDVSMITPFWRLIDPKSPLAKKISCGPEFVTAQRRAEQQNVG